MMGAFRTIRHLVVGLAAALAMLVPLWFVVTAQGGKHLDFWTPLQAFAHVREWAGLLLPATAIVGAAALLVAVAFRAIFGRANAPGVGGYVAGAARRGARRDLRRRAASRDRAQRAADP